MDCWRASYSDTRTEAATQYQEEAQEEAPERFLRFVAVFVNRKFSAFSCSLLAMSGEVCLPHLSGAGPQFAIQAPPLNAGQVRASTTAAVKRLPGITEPGGEFDWILSNLKHCLSQ